MGFFKFDKKIETANLRLSDYNQIWTKFCFLDETGTLNNPTDPFFTVGIIKLSQPYYLMNKISYERDKRKFYDEMHFNRLSKNNIEFSIFAVEAFLNAKSTFFYSYTVNTTGESFKKEFDDNHWRAYEQLTVRLIKCALSEKEILILLADRMTTPKKIKFEVDVKKKVNRDLKRLALAGVCRIDSRTNDLLQVVDLLIGCVSYDLKTKAGMIEGRSIYKKQLLDFLKTRLGVSSFACDLNNRSFNVLLDEAVKIRINTPK